MMNELEAKGELKRTTGCHLTKADWGYVSEKTLNTQEANLEEAMESWWLSLSLVIHSVCIALKNNNDCADFFAKLQSSEMRESQQIKFNQLANLWSTFLIEG